jgi:hypothetical protein
MAQPQLHSYEGRLDTIESTRPRETETAPETVTMPAPVQRRAFERGRLGTLSLGVALGITAALIVFLMGLTTALFGWGILVVQVLATLFIGYEPTFVGAICGAVWAFVDFFVAGVIFASIYNRLLRRHPYSIE